MDDSSVSKIVIAIISSLLGFGSSLVIAWLTIRSKGLTSADAAEIADRGQFRVHLMAQVKELISENKALREELELWRKRVYSLEEQVTALTKRMDRKE